MTSNSLFALGYLKSIILGGLSWLHWWVGFCFYFCFSSILSHYFLVTVKVTRNIPQTQRSHVGYLTVTGHSVKLTVVLCRKKHFDLFHYSSCGMEHFRILSLSFLTSLLFSLISRMTDTGVSFISQNFRTNQNLQSLMKHYKWFILEILHWNSPQIQ